MKFGSKDIPFVYKGNKLVYPNPIKDGLLLWYDFKGMRNADTNKEVAKDLSGNGNDGTLTNFNFTEESGYKDNTLVFDGVDDKLSIPELELDETAMSVMHDGKLYAYEDDKVLTVGEDGEIISEKINLLLSTSQTMKKIFNTGWGNHVGSFVAEPFKTYTARVYIKPTTNSASIQIIFKGSDGLNIKESGAGGWIRPGEEGYATRTYQAPEGTVSAWIQIRNNERLDSVGTMLEYKELQVFEGDYSQFYSSNPKDYKTTTLSPASLTDLQLYNKTLRKEELLHNAESKGLKKLKDGVVVQDGLVLHYDFSHESNNSEYKDKAFDYSGNGNHGVLQNFNFTEDSGYEGEGLKFDGVDDRIETNSIIWGQQSISSSFVFKLNSLNNPLTSIMQMGTGIGRLWLRIVNNQLSLNTYWGQSAADYSITKNYASVPTDSVFYITIVVDRENNNQTLYLDGESVGSQDISLSEGIDWANTIRLGLNSSYLPIDGYYRDVKFYNRPLTPEEIQHNYTIEKEKFDIIEGEM